MAGTCQSYMEFVENTLDVELDEFLDRPLFCLLAQESDAGPRVSPLWYLWEDEAIWIIATLGKSYPERVEQHPRTALAIVDFDPKTGLVQHVGFRGSATLEPFDDERTERLLRRYLGDDKSEWDEMFIDLNEEKYRLIHFEPETVVARDQSYSPSFN